MVLSLGGDIRQFFAGAALATLLLRALIGKQGSAGLTLPGSGISTTTAMLWEAAPPKDPLQPLGRPHEAQQPRHHRRPRHHKDGPRSSARPRWTRPAATPQTRLRTPR